MLVKKFFSFFLCFVIVFSSFSLTAFAFGDPAVDVILFIFQLFQDWVDDTNDDIKSMSGDEFYDFLQNTGNLDSSLWQGVYRALGHNPMNNGTVMRPKTITSKGDEALGLMEDAHYSACEVSKDLLDSLDAVGVDFSSKNGERFFSLDEISLSTTDSIRSDLIKFNGDVITNLGSSWYKSADYNGYYIENCGISPNAISFYPGGTAPPMFFVPHDCLMYQCGIPLPSDRFYIVLGDNLLLSVDGRVSENKFFPYYFGGVDESTITFGILHNSRKENMELYSDGRVVGITNTSSFPGWSCVDLFEKMAGFFVQTPDFEITPPPSTFLPDDIPYGDNDTVIVLVPEDDSGGDVVYMSPSNYYDHVNNGTIVEGDYINDYSDETINNVTNNYNNYTSGSDFDDSNITSKLDDIIDYLKKIYKKVKGKVSNIDIEFDIGDLLGVDDKFDRDSVELDWKSLVQSKLPILAEAAEVVRSFEESSSPLKIDFDIPLPAGSHDSIPFSIDFSWYDTNEIFGKTGREYVREGLSYIVYFVAFVALYRRTDMIFADY